MKNLRSSSLSLPGGDGLTGGRAFDRSALGMSEGSPGKPHSVTSQTAALGVLNLSEMTVAKDGNLFAVTHRD